MKSFLSAVKTDLVESTDIAMSEQPQPNSRTESFFCSARTNQLMMSKTNDSSACFKGLKLLYSYGIILYRLQPLTHIKEYMLICRRHTFGFVELVRGKFNNISKRCLVELLRELTKEEFQHIRTQSFEWLWNYLWMNGKHNVKYVREFNEAQYKFSSLQNSLSYREAMADFDESQCWDEPEWGFPKGKRDRRESTLRCAIREMKEETGIDPSMYVIDENVNPVGETFRGTDRKMYSNLYYVAHAKSATWDPPSIDSVEQMREVSQSVWATVEEIGKKFRPYNTDKLAMIQTLDRQLSNILFSSDSQVQNENHDLPVLSQPTL